MGLWIKGALVLLQGGLVAAAAKLGRRLQGLATGASLALILFVWLPEGLQLCSTMILVSALALGVILSVFLRESVGRHRVLLWNVWLLLYSFLQAAGVVPLWSLLYLLPVGLALTEGRFPILPLLSAALGWAAGCTFTLPAKWQGLLLCLGCGLLSESITHHNNHNLAGGIAIGVILSFI